MARVYNPLHSESASGSINGNLTFAAVRDQRPRVIRRTINGEEVDAHYPARIMSGQGIARSKIRARPDLKRRAAASGARITPAQDYITAAFTSTRKLARFLVTRNTRISRFSGDLLEAEAHPWWQQMFHQRADNREIRKYPGQPQGESTSWRRRVTAAVTPDGFIMRELIGRNHSNIRMAEAMWNNTFDAWQRRWASQQARNLAGLERNIVSPGDIQFDQGFALFFCAYAFMVTRFILPPRFNSGLPTAFAERDAPDIPNRESTERGFNEFLQDRRLVDITRTDPVTGIRETVTVLEEGGRVESVGSWG